MISKFISVYARVVETLQNALYYYMKYIQTNLLIINILLL